MSEHLLPIVANIQPLIRVVRDTQVILDSDLARLYNVETRVLNQAVKRNLDRFPEDFMFQLNRKEASELQHNQQNTDLTSQFVISNRGGKRTLPYAFTEQGIAMLSGILRSPIAIEVNIRIMRAFVEMRHFVANNSNLFYRLEALEHHQLLTDNKIEKVFKILEQDTSHTTQGVFFDGQIYDAYTFITKLIRSAKQRVVLIDNYIDETVLTMLDKRDAGVTATIYTAHISQALQLDIRKHNEQYESISVHTCQHVHDRFCIIDDQVYLIGASIKDAGKKLFGFSLMQSIVADDLLDKLK